MSNISILPEHIARLIRAGEVITSPARVMLELIQNSLDANATDIVIEASADGGYAFLSVTDNGMGMNARDLCMAPLLHATSKTPLDWDGKRTPEHYGFRGEALTSIGRVAEVTISSRTHDGDWGWKTSVLYGSEPTPPQPIGMPRGTKVEVQGLFEKMPARKAMSGSPAQTRAMLREALRHMALCVDNVSFELRFDGRKSNTRLRIAQSEGLPRIRSLLKQKEDFALPVNGKTCCGFLIPGKTSNLLCVSGRPVLRDASIRKALKYLENETGRSFSWFGRIHATEIDHNVHAAKEEVGHAVTSELWKFILTDFKSAMSSNYSEYIQTRAFTKNGGGDIESHSEGIEVLGIMHDNFIIARENQELLIVDAHAASERITLERIRQGRLETNNIPSVTLQVPENTEVIAEKLRSFGFVADDMGDGYIVISATPYGIPITPSSGKQILKALREGEDAVLPIIAKIACHISFRTGDGMTDNRALELLEAMKTVENFQVCPHGRPTIFRISRKSLEKMFGRG